MNPERNDRIKQLCLEARELAPNERAAFLAQACAGDDQLRREVESLLSFDETGTGFLDQTAWKLVAQEMVAEETNVLLGQTIGHYQIQAVLGAGGMGKVFLAQDTRLGRQVALKFLPPQFTADPEHVRRFEQEARAASALNHSNIVTIHEVRQHEGLHFIVMEYVSGNTLRSRLQQGRMTHEDAIAIAAQVADALAAAHHIGIVHRDIKPENIVVRADDRVKVLDFGIAKLGEERVGDRATGGAGETGNETSEMMNSPTRPVALSPTLPLSTVLGSVKGTVKYMSPEQARGESLNGQSDIFALGQMLLEMVTGKHLFAGQSKDEVLERLRGTEEPLANGYKLEAVPKELERIIRKSLERDLPKRYATARELLNDLTTLQQRAATKWWRRGVGISVCLVLLSLLALAGAAWFSITETWEERIIRGGHTKAVYQLAFSPDGQRLASVSDDGKLIVWNFVRREPLAVLTDHRGAINGVAYSPDGKWLVTGGDDQTVIVRAANDLQPVAVLREPESVIQALAFSPHGRWLASSGQSGKVILWEVSTWKRVREFQATEMAERGNLFFTSDNQRLLLAHRQMWDVQTGRDLSASIPTEIFGPMALAHDGSELVSIGATGKVYFRRLRDYRLLHQQPVHRLNGRAAAYSHDGKLVVTGADDVVFWDAQTHRVLTHLEYADNVWSLAFSPDDRWLVAGYGDGAIIVWDAVERRRVADFGGHTAKVRNVGFLPDGQKFFSASEDNSVILWDAATGAKETVFQWDTFSLSHSTLFDQGRQLFIYDYQSRKSLIYHLVERRAAEFQVAPIDTALTMVPHRQQILSGHGVYDATDGQRLVDFRARGQLIFAGYIFSADEQWLVNPEEKSLQVWNTTTWEVTEQAELTEVMPIRLALSADGQQLAVGCSKGEVLLWRLHPLRQVAVLGRHKNHVQSLAFSPDGTRLASAGDDNTIKLWNLTTRRLMSDIGMHTAPILSVAFSPDGKQLISGEHDRSVRVYTRQRRLWGWELDN